MDIVHAPQDNRIERGRERKREIGTMGRTRERARMRGEKRERERERGKIERLKSGRGVLHRGGTNLRNAEETNCLLPAIRDITFQWAMKNHAKEKVRKGETLHKENAFG